MAKNSKIIYLFVSVVFFIFLGSYLSDSILLNGYKLGENPVFDITFVQNSGASFNLFQGYKVFLIAFAMIAFIMILAYAVKHIKKISTFALFYTALLSAGIFNNMYERLTLGFVRDFIKLNFIDFPIFNISDIFINIGVFGIIIIILKNNYFKNQQ